MKLFRSTGKRLEVYDIGPVMYALDMVDVTAKGIKNRGFWVEDTDDGGRNVIKQLLAIRDKNGRPILVRSSNLEMAPLTEDDGFTNATVSTDAE